VCNALLFPSFSLRDHRGPSKTSGAVLHYSPITARDHNKSVSSWEYAGEQQHRIFRGVVPVFVIW